jgi:hypothetical protein
LIEVPEEVVLSDGKVEPLPGGIGSVLKVSSD